MTSNLGLPHREPFPVLVPTFCFLCGYRCWLSGKGRRQVFTVRRRDGMPCKDVHVWNTSELPNGRQNTASPRVQLHKPDTRSTRLTTHGHHAPTLKTPLQAHKRTFPNVLGDDMLHGQTFLVVMRRQSLKAVQKVHNSGEAPGRAALSVPTCLFLPRTSTVSSGEARETCFPGDDGIALPWSYVDSCWAHAPN